jgi:hypothetical protein
MFHVVPGADGMGLQVGVRRWVRSRRSTGGIAAVPRVAERRLDMQPPTERARCACGALVNIPYQAWMARQPGSERLADSIYPV